MEGKVKVYDITTLKIEQICEFVKICYKHKCRNIMTSEEPIFSNFCEHWEINFVLWIFLDFAKLLDLLLTLQFYFLWDH